jgi:hypothetical protein
MKIKTAYPVIVENEKLDMSEYYANAAGTSTPESYSAGDVNVSTSYPVIINGSDVSPNDFYSNVDEPPMPEQVAAKQKGMFWDKVKGGWSKISNNAGAQFALEKVAEFMKMKQGGGFGGGGFGGGGFTGGLPDSTPTPAPTPAAEPMSKTTKIVLVVGGVLVVGLVLVGVFAKKK